MASLYNKGGLLWLSDSEAKPGVTAPVMASLFRYNIDGKMSLWYIEAKPDVRQ